MTHEKVAFGIYTKTISATPEHVDTTSTYHYISFVNPETTKNEPYIYNGIDRVKNEVGYEVENCVACCKTCNIMKQGLSKEDFLNHIKGVLRHTETRIYG